MNYVGNSATKSFASLLFVLLLHFAAPVAAHSQAESIESAFELFLQNRPKNSLDILNRLAKSSPQNANVFINRGAVLEKLGRHKEALADENLAIRMIKSAKLNSEDQNSLSTAYQNRAAIYEDLGQLTNAESDLRGAMKTGFPRGSAHEQLGKILDKKGKRAEAITEWKIARQLYFKFGAKEEELARIKKLIDASAHSNSQMK